VRELENILEQAFLLCRGDWIELHHLPPELRPAGEPGGGEGLNLKAAERRLILAALDRHKGNRSQAARELGIDPSTLYRKLKALGSERKTG